MTLLGSWPITGLCYRTFEFLSYLWTLCQFPSALPLGLCRLYMCCWPDFWTLFGPRFLGRCLYSSDLPFGPCHMYLWTLLVFLCLTSSSLYVFLAYHWTLFGPLDSCLISGLCRFPLSYQSWADANVFAPSRHRIMASPTRKHFDDAKRKDAPPLKTTRSRKTRRVTDVKFCVTGVGEIS